MRIQVLSDIHLEFNSFKLPDLQADVIVLAGDTDTTESGVDWINRAAAQTPVIYVLGNHEYYKNIFPDQFSVLKNFAEGTQVHVLEKASLVIGEVEFFGCTLWTDFELYGQAEITMQYAKHSMNDYTQIYSAHSAGPLKPKEILAEHKKSLHWLCSAIEKSKAKYKVVVTHHAPSEQSLPVALKGTKLGPAYASHLDDKIHNLTIDYWIHGHTHTACQYFIGSTQVICNARGYPGQSHGFDKNFLLHI